MSINKLIQEIKAECNSILVEIEKTTKAAECRTRKHTLKLQKLGAIYRKQSIARHK